MNQEAVSFQSQYVLETLLSIDKSFIYNITHELNNDVTGIVWMISYMRYIYY